MILGKLKKVLNEKCPYCNSKLQLRTFQSERIVEGENIFLDEDVIICPSEYCDYQRDSTPKRKRRELKDNANTYGNNDSNSGRFGSTTAENGRGSYRRSIR